MDSLSLKDYLFRVYTKFTIVEPNRLSDYVKKIQQYNLTDLVKLLVFGCIDTYGCNPYLIKDDFWGLLYDSDGKSSPLAVSLLKDSNLYQVDLGYLLTKDKKDQYKVSLSTFMLILMFYNSTHYRSISYNIKIAIGRLLKHIDNFSNRFPEINKDKTVLYKLLEIVSDPKYNDIVKPSLFHDVIQDIGKQLEDYVKKWSSGESKDWFANYRKSLFASGDVSSQLKELMEAMFELFKAGYYPASISSVFPDTVLATLPNRDVYGQLDYLLLLDSNHCPASEEPVNRENNLARVVFRGSYGGKSILYEYKARWRYIEERLPGAWQLFRIIYKRLEEGEYNTDKYSFSNYSFIIEDENESILKAAKVRWLNLFSSFILGHVINLVGNRYNRQLYKIAAPVINPRNSNHYLVPNNFHRLEKPIIYYEVNGEMIVPKSAENVKWLKYQGDKVYTPTSGSISDTASYDSSYAIVVPTDEITDVKIDSYGGNIDNWNEVVFAEMDRQVTVGGSEKKNRLVFKLHSDYGEEVNIALKASSASQEADSIEPGKLNLSKDKTSE